MEQKSLSISLPGFGNLVKRAFSSYKSKFWTLTGIMFLPFAASVIVAIIGAIIVLLLFSGSIAPDGNFESEGLFGMLDSIFSSPLPLIVIFFLAWLVIAILGLWANVAVLCAISQEGIKVKQAFKLAWKKIISYLWISSLSFVLILGAAVLFIGPGMIFAIWFFLVPYVFINEGKRGMSALLKSKQLIKRVEWTMFWRLLIVFLGFIIINAILTPIPMGSTLFGFIYTPFFHVLMFSFYKDIVEAKKDVSFEEPKKSEKSKIIFTAVAGYVVLIALLSTGLFLTLRALIG
jgi:hypothetical protein